jgi:hypothetical protein
MCAPEAASGWYSNAGKEIPEGLANLLFLPTNSVAKLTPPGLRIKGNIKNFSYFGFKAEPRGKMPTLFPVRDFPYLDATHSADRQASHWQRAGCIPVHITVASTPLILRHGGHPARES